MTRIATYFQNQNNLRTLQQANQGAALSSYQISTGLRAQKISDYNTDISRVLNLRDVSNRTEVYLDNLKNAETTVKATEGALQQMLDVLSDALNTATLGRNQNSGATRGTLAPKAQSSDETNVRKLCASKRFCA